MHQRWHSHRHICLGALLAVLVVLCGCGRKRRLVIFHADSLLLPFGELEKRFEAEHPDVDVQTESSGSNLAARKIADLGRHCDLVAVADYRIIDKLLIPDYASWSVEFARNEIVIAYTDKTRRSSEITAQNWYDILTSEGILFGHSDPLLDPCGYWTRLCWELADLHYQTGRGDDARSISESLRAASESVDVPPDANDLIRRLQVGGSLDYAFLYKSVAEQHHLPYVTLPDEINLGNPDQAEFYAKAKIELKDRKGKAIVHTGAPIVFAFTITKTARNPKAAVDFAKLLLSKDGQAVLTAHNQPIVEPARAKGAGVPTELAGLIKRVETETK